VRLIGQFSATIVKERRIGHVSCYMFFQPSGAKQ